MKLVKDFCFGCGQPEWHGPAETEDLISECTCEGKRVKCDGCGHVFLKKDMSLNNMFLGLCKCCNGSKPYQMDNVATGRFKPIQERAHTMLCVEQFGDKLQLTIRSHHLGLSVLFPAMTKKELVNRWLNTTLQSTNTDVDLLFDAAILRLMPRYLSKSDISRLRGEWIEDQQAALIKMTVVNA